MSKLRISKEESDKGWAFDLKRVQVDLLHLLCLFLADEKYASILFGEYDPLWDLTSFSEPEMTRILVNSAVIGRAIDDREDKFLLDSDTFCGEITIDGEIEKLNLRESFNKIIHAEAFDLIVNETNGKFHYIEPEIYLHGSYRGKEWEAKLDVVSYIREFTRNIAGLEKDKQFT
jgi:hypothetical protein